MEKKTDNQLLGPPVLELILTEILIMILEVLVLVVILARTLIVDQRHIQDQKPELFPNFGTALIMLFLSLTFMLMALCG